LSLDPESLSQETQRQFQRWVQHLADTLPLEKRLDFKESVETRVNWEHFYVPPAQYRDFRLQRLSFIACLGAVFGGALSLHFLGSLFKDAMTAYIIGAPIGSSFLVWLFAWLMRNPQKATLVQTLLGLGSAGLGLGVVIATVKRSLFPKSRLILSGVLASLIGFFLVFAIQLFKPKKTVDTRLRRDVMESQLFGFLQTVELTYKALEASPPASSSYKPDTTRKSQDNPYVSFSLEQLHRAVESRDPHLALTAADSLVNSLTAKGVKPHSLKDGEPFTRELLDYYEPFGILKPGDAVEVLKTAWIDDKGRSVYKGKLKRISKNVI